MGRIVGTIYGGWKWGIGIVGQGVVVWELRLWYLLSVRLGLVQNIGWIVIERVIDHSVLVDAIQFLCRCGCEWIWYGLVSSERYLVESYGSLMWYLWWYYRGRLVTVRKECVIFRVWWWCSEGDMPEFWRWTSRYVYQGVGEYVIWIWDCGVSHILFGSHRW